MRIHPCALAPCLSALHARMLKSLATSAPPDPAMTIAWRNVQFEVQTTHPAYTSSAWYTTLALVLSRMNPAHVFVFSCNRKRPLATPLPMAYISVTIEELADFASDKLAGYG